MDTDELMVLCNALEVPSEELNKPFSIWRFDTLNIRGVDNLTSTDIYDYFGPIHPHSVEWLSNICCNVTFDSEARACNALQAVATGLIIHKNAGPTSGKLSGVEDLSLDLEVFSSDTLEIPVPPNYRYILGGSHSKAKSIILRFATINDKKITSTSELEKPPGIIQYKPKGALSAALNAISRRTRGRASNSMDLRTKVVRNATAFKMSMRADEEEAQQLALNRRNLPIKSRTGNSKSADLRSRLESRSGRSGTQTLLRDRLRVGPVGRSNDVASNGVVKNKNNIWRRNLGSTHVKTATLARNDLREVLSTKNSMVRVRVSYDDDNMLVD